MPYANNQGVRIHYEVEGQGESLALVHGFGFSSRIFRSAGWVDALSDHYRLILMDVRGHGQSDKPHSPQDYRIELLVRDVLSVLDDLGIVRAHHLGYSMGGRIGWGTAKLASQRLRSLIIGGADASDPEPEHSSVISEREGEGYGFSIAILL